MDLHKLRDKNNHKSKREKLTRATERFNPDAVVGHVCKKMLSCESEGICKKIPRLLLIFNNLQQLLVPFFHIVFPETKKFVDLFTADGSIPHQVIEYRFTVKHLNHLFLLAEISVCGIKQKVCRRECRGSSWRLDVEGRGGLVGLHHSGQYRCRRGATRSCRSYFYWRTAWN